MQVGMVGLGRMGGNMTQRLLRGGHEVVAWARTRASVDEAADHGAVPADSLEDLVVKLAAPRTVWLMIPAGPPTADTVEQLTDLLQRGDTIIDGGNSRYTESMQRAATLKEHGIEFVDAGTSGGIWGLENGYCLMIGATDETFARLEPIFSTLAPDNGYARVGPPGAGHFVKMVHNGIEYALMQAYGEGLELLNASDFDLDLASVAEVWRHGSVVRSWLLDLIARALSNDPKLESITGYVEDSGEGRWTVETAIDNAVPTPAIAQALFQRFASRQDESFSNKVIAALRKEFGGHAVRSKEQ
ncbi:MAG TPA: decarboxylating 6-phosphogluconate dehydrogenase [Actinomycetota bacterium]|nr:decarboxylating 6-phosphogluconate dehydrogenase [Actinomycetota bacterium]